MFSICLDTFMASQFRKLPPIDQYWGMQVALSIGNAVLGFLGSENNAAMNLAFEQLASCPARAPGMQEPERCMVWSDVGSLGRCR